MELSSVSKYGLTFDSASVEFNISEQMSILIKECPSPCDEPTVESESSDEVIVDSSSEEDEGNKGEENVTTMIENKSEIAQLKVCLFVCLFVHICTVLDFVFKISFSCLLEGLLKQPCGKSGLIKHCLCSCIISVARLCKPQYQTAVFTFCKLLN